MVPVNLRIERVKRNLSQAKMAKDLGINRSYVTFIELYGAKPGPSLAKKLERYFNKPIDYLLKKVEL